MRATLVAVALLSVMLIGPSIHANVQDELTAAEAREIGKEAFFWGMHPVDIYHLHYNFAQNELNPRAAGINRVSWFRPPMKALPGGGP